MEPWMVMICWALGVVAALFSWLSYLVLEESDECLDEDRYSYIDPDTGQRVLYAYPMPPDKKSVWRPATYFSFGLGATALLFVGLALWHWHVWPNW